MIQKVLILLHFIFASIVCKADYDALTASQLIEKSDLIAECKIIDVSDGYFEIILIDIIKGNSDQKHLTVVRFQNWTCASRWANYKIGQSELIFLKKDGFHNFWHTLGAGNEGEMGICGDSLYYKEANLRLDSLSKPLSFCDGDIFGYSYTLLDVKTSIKKYLIDVLIIKKQIAGKATRKYIVEYAFLNRIIAELKERKSK